MLSAVTPDDVAPPLSNPAGHGTTQGGAYTNDTLMRLVAGSQSGAASAAAVPIPAPAGPDAARTAVVPFWAAAPALPVRGARAVACAAPVDPAAVARDPACAAPPTPAVGVGLVAPPVDGPGPASATTEAGGAWAVAMGERLSWARLTDGTRAITSTVASATAYARYRCRPAPS